MSEISKVRRRKPKAGHSGTAKTPAQNGQYLSKAITRALDVLDSFREVSGEQSLMEISKRTRLPEASLFRILMTLQNREYLVQLKDGSVTISNGAERLFTGDAWTWLEVRRIVETADVSLVAKPAPSERPAPRPTRQVRSSK